MENIPTEKEYPFIEYRQLRGEGTVAVFVVEDVWGRREVVYNKHNLELKIAALKEKGQTTAEAERVLAEWPK